MFYHENSGNPERAILGDSTETEFGWSENLNLEPVRRSLAVAVVVRFGRIERQFLKKNPDVRSLRQQ
jgi:hypothetical protein